MKRLIILLLLLSCFRFSYAEELTAEQQQLAWKFIYDNMLPKVYLPYIYKNDIVINLKGEITSGDSTIVKDLIKDFQKAIPHLKIELSDKPGNLTLGLNNEKEYKVATHLGEYHDMRSVEMEFPVKLTNAQRKQFFYYNLFKGLTYSYALPKKYVDGLDGCVFKEADFNSITFSPFDLFILEKLYSSDFPIQLVRNLSPELQKTAWKFIRNKFMYGGPVDPVIYKSDIAIKLGGTVSSIDSICLNELINSLSSIIPNRKFYLAKENANLVITFSDTLKRITSFNVEGSEIKFTAFEVNFSKDISKDGRKKNLYYALCNSLIRYQGYQKEFIGNINGSAFDEVNPEDITYHPIDAFVLNKLYADDFKDQFKRQYINQFSYREYLVMKNSNELNLFFKFLGFLLSVIFFTLLIIKGAFKDHNWNWISFIKQGLFLIFIAVFYLLCIKLSDLKFDKNDFKSIQHEVVSFFLVVNLIYLTERLILKDRDFGGSKIIVIFFTTLVMSVAILLMNSLRYYSLEDFSVPRYYSYLPGILLASLARCLYVFLNDRYKSIINQKDVELAQMGEFQKQAELQSLRAKINPHFLYNALNSIASLATTDARKTEQMALALSDFFKYAINREQKQLNTLSEELNAIRTYLEIEKVRFGERLSFEIDCPEDLLNIQIPQLLIQPLVENAIKHGLSQITENGLIRISVNRAENQLKIRVYDNGPAFPDGPLSGFGIQNTQERIALLYGAKATINWQNGAEKFIEISIPV
jgi:sensor histidine kinase YesM